MKKTLLILTLSIVSFSSYSADYYGTERWITDFDFNTQIFSQNSARYELVGDRHIQSLKSDGTVNNNYYNSQFTTSSSSPSYLLKLTYITKTQNFNCFQNVMNSMSGLTDAEFKTFYSSDFLDYNHNFIPDIYENEMILSNDIIFYLKNIIMFICFGLGFSIGALFLKGLL